MPSHRMDRINEEIKRELSSVFMELKDPRIAKIISVTGVNTTQDLRYSKVWVSVVEDNKREGTLKGLNSSKAFIRREIGRRLNLRLTPEFSFEMDDSILRGAKISKIISSLDIERDEDERNEGEN